MQLTTHSHLRSISLLPSQMNSTKKLRNSFGRVTRQLIQLTLTSSGLMVSSISLVQRAHRHPAHSPLHMMPSLVSTMHSRRKSWRGAQKSMYLLQSSVSLCRQWLRRTTSTTILATRSSVNSSSQVRMRRLSAPRVLPALRS